MSLQLGMKDEHVFTDKAFREVKLSTEDEQLCMLVQVSELSTAKRIFGLLSMKQRCYAIRYLMSQRLYYGTTLPKTIRQELMERRDDTIGSVCSIEGHIRACVSVENQIITRVMYVCEALDFNEFEDLRVLMVTCSPTYEIITDVIKHRLEYHYSKARS